jgi:glycosyltransferase involved in cell wall biosynthesis
MKISILMLTYNCEKYLAQAIASVLQFTNIELILIDPGSTDRSREICVSFSKLYPNRVKLVFEQDRGPADGLNNGLKYVTGEIVGVLNGDDFYLPGALDVVRIAFTKSESLGVFQASGFIFNETTNRFKFVLPTIRNRNGLKYITYGGSIFFHPGLFFKSSENKNLQFNPDNNVNWDLEHFSLLLARNPECEINTSPVSVFRVTKSSITGSGKYSNERIEREKQIAMLPIGKLPLLGLFVVATSLRILNQLRSISRLFMIQSKRTRLK